jgi:hypothetical protein
MNKANELRDTAGPDAIFEKSRYTSIDDFLHGKTANNKRESRAEITKKTAEITAAVFSNAIQDPEIRRSMSPQFLATITHKGGTLADLEAAISGDAVASNKFA